MNTALSFALLIPVFMMCNRCGLIVIANKRLHSTKKQPFLPGLSQNLSMSTMFAVRTVSSAEHPAYFAYTYVSAFVSDVFSFYQPVIHLLFYTCSVVSINRSYIDVVETCP